MVAKAGVRKNLGLSTTFIFLEWSLQWVWNCFFSGNLILNYWDFNSRFFKNLFLTPLVYTFFRNYLTILSENLIPATQEFLSLIILLCFNPLCVAKHPREPYLKWFLRLRFFHLEFLEEKHLFFLRNFLLENLLIYKLLTCFLVILFNFSFFLNFFDFFLADLRTFFD